MNQGARIALFAGLVLAVGVAVTAYAVGDFQRYQEVHASDPLAASTGVDEYRSADRIVFRHTGVDNSYGQVAMVSLADPGGARAFTDVACDRVDASATGASCLVTERGVVTKFRALDLGVDWTVDHTTPLAGIPSRTRLSGDGSLVASTSFVTGHSYMTAGFSTATEIREVGGRSYGDLERFQLVIDGREVSPADRNVWGVTFRDERGFFATVATGGSTHLVEGDLVERTLTSVAENAECPSLSPDGTRVAFKVDLDPGADTRWSAAVLDLESGRQTQLDTPGIDDQVEWLDAHTLLYGLAREAEPGVTDIWSVDVRSGAEPSLLVEQAWSPSVVREASP